MTNNIEKITEQRSEYVQYSGVKIDVSCRGESFTVLNLAQETMHRSIPGHRHGSGDWEFHLITGGTGLVELAGKQHPVKGGDWFLVGPGVEHMQISYREAPMGERTVYFHGDEKRKEDMCGLFPSSYGFGRDNGRMSDILEMIFREMKERQPGHTTCVRLLIEHLLLEIWRRMEESAENTPVETEVFPPTELEQMQDFLVEKAFLYRYAELSLKDLADLVGLSERQLQRHLRQRYGDTFLNLRTAARLSAAKMLLLNTKLSILQISEEVGYSTAEHFTAVFTKEIGCSPREYRFAGFQDI